MSKIEQYIISLGITITEAARQLKTSQGYLYDICKSRRLPGRSMARRIEDWSHGAVPMRTWDDE